MSQGDLQQDGDRDRDPGDWLGPGRTRRRRRRGAACVGPFCLTQARRRRPMPLQPAACGLVAGWLDRQAAGTCGWLLHPKSKTAGCSGLAWKYNASRLSVATKVDRQSHAGLRAGQSAWGHCQSRGAVPAVPDVVRLPA